MEDRGNANFAEDRTREWNRDQFLDGLLERVDPRLGVFDEQGQPLNMSRLHFHSLLRKLKIFRWLDGLDFESIIDVGSGFDHYPYLAWRRYGANGFYSDFNHQVNLPLDGQQNGRWDRAVTANVARLPFADGAFDVAICSEVLEHVMRPVEALAELVRITRKGFVLTSLEALSRNSWERFLSHHRVDVRIPHIERNFFVAEDFDAMLGPNLRHENLFFSPAHPISLFESDAEQEKVYASFRDADSLARALAAAVAEPAHGHGAMGVLLVSNKPDVDWPAPRPERDYEIARWLIAEFSAIEQSWYDLLRQWAEHGRVAPPEDRPVAASLLERLRCPDCRGMLQGLQRGLRCAACASEFSSDYGVPVLHPKRPHDSAEEIEQCLDVLCGPNDHGRRRHVRRLMRRLRRAEKIGPSRRAFLALDAALRNT